MIVVDWRDELSAAESAELAALIAEAADYDAEAGFSTATPAPDVAPDLVVFQALARLTPGRHGSPDAPLAAFLRLDVDRAGDATAQLVVRPNLRSLGVATLMLETLAGRDGPGWGGTGAIRIRCWAHANHPAAERMAARFGAEPERVTWRLVRGSEVRYTGAEDAEAVLAARADGFVHEHSDVCYTLLAGSPRIPASN